MLVDKLENGSFFHRGIAVWKREMQHIDRRTITLQGGTMNYLWGFMIVLGILYAACTGTLPEVTQAAIDSSKEAVTLCITMTGVMSLWVGIMRIAEKAGLIKSAVRCLKPLLRFLFPRIPREHAANQYIAENFIANVFGLGWAATPAGIRAMEELEKLEEERREGNSEHMLSGKHSMRRKKRKVRAVAKGIASNEMCTFLILNISSLQLIPVNMIAYRSQYGSVNPTTIVGPAIAATAVSTLAAVVFCKVMEGKRRI